MSEKLEVGAYEAKTHLSDLLRKVREGAHFTITQRGEPVADLIPTGAAEAAHAQAAGADAARRMRQFMRHDRGLVADRLGVVTTADIKAMIAEGRD